MRDKSTNDDRNIIREATIEKQVNHGRKCHCCNKWIIITAILSIMTWMDWMFGVTGLLSPKWMNDQSLLNQHSSLIKLPNGWEESESIIVSVYLDLPKRMSNISRDNHRRYCQSHGYTCLEHDHSLTSFFTDINIWTKYLPFKDIKHHHKSFVLADILQSVLNDKKDNHKNQVEWIVWMDADALFTNCQSTPQNIIDIAKSIYGENKTQSASIFLSGDKLGLNNGIFVMRPTQDSLKFLIEWCKLTVYILRNRLGISPFLSFQDQLFMLAALFGEYQEWIGQSLWKIKSHFSHHPCISPTYHRSQVKKYTDKCIHQTWKESVLFLPIESMNSRSSNWMSDDWIIHFAGHKIDQKIRLMSNYSKKLKCDSSRKVFSN